MSFDPITYAMAKAYSNSKGGYIETVKEQIVFNGDTDGKAVIPGTNIGFDEANFVMVSDKAFSAEELSGITIVRNGEKVRYDNNEFKSSNNYGIVGIAIDLHDYALFFDESAAATFGVDVGAYFAMSIDGSWYVAEVSTETETIHPIDPKFLPGVCLPVVETADINAITTAESAVFTAAAENGLPCVLKWFSDEDGVGMAIIFNLQVIEGVYQYSALASGSYLTIAKDNETGLWALAT